MAPITLIIIGAGSRGASYAEYASAHPEQARVVGVAEPREFYRADRRRARHPGEQRVCRLARGRRRAPARRRGDHRHARTRMHVEPADRLRRPRATTSCWRSPWRPPRRTAGGSSRPSKASGILFAVCHVLRYTAYTQRLKAMLDSGAHRRGRQHPAPGAGRLLAPGALLRARQLAQRGRILAHAAGQVLPRPGLDPLHHGRAVPAGVLLRLASSTSAATQQPAGAADRCLDCAVEADCPYSASKIYLGRCAQGHTGWPVDVLTADPTDAGV